MKKHSLKTWPPFFEEVVSGDKTFEVRINDRGFDEGDLLKLCEYTPDNGYTGREIVKKVSYVMLGGAFGLKEGWVIMGLKDVETQSRNESTPIEVGPDRPQGREG
jgi:hypothetical protein